MQKLSVLIFSKDDLGQALGLIRKVHDYVDEVVLMDASSKTQRNWIAGEKRRLRLSKLRIHRVIALGYREPLMMYALAKCRNEWVLDLDTDMLPSNALIKDAGALMSNRRHVAYAIALYSVHSASSRTFVSYQVRLFKKRRMEFRGVLHEKPIVHGAFGTLPQDAYYIDHFTTGMVHSTGESYAEMERFERFTYKEHNARMLEQVDRARRKSSASGAALSPWKKMMLATLKLYQVLGFKAEDKEVSNFDYFAYMLLRQAAHQTRRRSVRGVLGAFPKALGYRKAMREWRMGEHGDADFQIARIVHRIGVVKFLGLDNPRRVDAINARYMNRKQGIELLIYMLRERYEKLDEKTRKAYILGK